MLITRNCELPVADDEGERSILLYVGERAYIDVIDDGRDGHISRLHVGAEIFYTTRHTDPALERLFADGSIQP